MALKVFSLCGRESEDLTQSDVCVSGSLRVSVAAFQWRPCVSVHSEAFILPESLSTVFSGIVSTFERSYFLNWQ